MLEVVTAGAASNVEAKWWGEGLEGFGSVEVKVMAGVHAGAGPGLPHVSAADFGH